MAITFRSVSFGAGSGSVIVAAPTGTSNDDVMLAYITRADGSGASTGPTGWTVLTSVTNASISQTVLVGVYGMGGIGTGPWTFTGTVAGTYGEIASFIGADGSSPGTVNSIRANASGTYGSSSITTTQDNALVVCSFTPIGSSVWSAESCASGPTLTEVTDANSAYKPCLAIGTKTTAGATGASTATPGSPSTNVGTIIQLLAPTVIVSIGIASSEIFGDNAVGTNCTFVGTSTSESFGLSNVGVIIYPVGLQSSEIFGNYVVVLRLLSPVSYGNVKYNTSIYNMPKGDYTKDTVPPTPYS